MSFLGNIILAEVVEQRLEFARFPTGWWGFASIVLVVLLVSVVGLLYAREQRSGAPRSARGVLATLRILVVLVLAVVWLEPIRATYIHREIESPTLVLVDASASMGLRDQGGEFALAGGEEGNAEVPTREARAVELMAGNEPTEDEPGAEAAEGLLSRLSKKNPVKVYGFSDGAGLLAELPRVAQRPSDDSSTNEAGESPATRNITVEADGIVSDIGRSIRQAIESHPAGRVAGVVVLSDGQFNRGEPVETVARYAEGKRLPIYTIGIGDPAPPKNISIASVESPANVFVDDPFEVRATLDVQGLRATDIEVQLHQRTAAGETGRMIDSKRVRVDATGKAEPAVFEHQLDEAGQVRLAIVIPEQPGESLRDDNRSDATVRALDNEMRVLVVAGGPSWEYRYLTRLLERDATVDLSCWLQSADESAVRDGDTVIDHMPQEMSELAEYDAIVLVDPQGSQIDEAWGQNVERLIANNGMGLLYVAGRKNTPRIAHEQSMSTILSLLPVAIEPGESDLLLNELGHFQKTESPVSTVAESSGHEVLRLADDPAVNEEIWSELPGVYWHYPVLRAKPVASVLLRHSSPRMRGPEGGHVLLATQFLGAGRTAFMAYDGTWRWRQFGDRYFNRFWIQLLRYLVEGKLLSGQKRGMIQTQRDRYAVGEPVTLEARLMDPQHLPLDEPSVSSSIVLPDGELEAVELEAQSNRPGWYRGRFVATQVGTYVIRIDLPGGAGTPSALIQKELRVGRPDLEFRETRLNQEGLSVLASMSYGGRYYDVEDALQIADEIEDQTATLVVTGDSETLWDRWWTLAILLGLLGTEWALRKRYRLL